MHAAAKYVEKALTVTAGGAWAVYDRLNRRHRRAMFTPVWSDLPLQDSQQKVRPPLGWPRETDSLCPDCIRRARQEVLDGQRSASDLILGRVGRIRALILERDGAIVMEKRCPEHGLFEDVLSIDPAFLRHVESSFPGSDLPAHADAAVHHHGDSTIRFGRGAVLNIDLTNRCNMMCHPCFTDANQVGFVHELSWPEIQGMLDRALAVKPRRQLSVQFTGGEPTLSPHFLDAIRYAKQIGYNSVQAATNGIEFARRPEFARAAADAGLRFAYLQFDGIGNAANAHRRVANLFDVKLQAIEHLWQAGVDVIPVITLINGVNSDQVGPIVRFAIENPRKISFLAFQPVSFTGRDEAITPERRRRQRYTLSHLAHDVRQQTGLGDPARDWLPISFVGHFTDWADVAHGADAPWGNLACSCHPDCGAGMAVMVDKDTSEAVPVTAFLDAEQLARDVTRVTDAARGRRWSVLGLALALARNYDPFKAPSRFRLADLLAKFDKGFGATHRDYGKVTLDRTPADIARRRSDRWSFLFVAGMWFQDLYTYDFRRTERCVIPYATEDGEISFCAYNTGVGFRQLIEKQHMTATLATWYGRHGRHEIFTGRRSVPLPTVTHSLRIDEAAMAGTGEPKP